jgi:hypothetical protein
VSDSFVTVTPLELRERPGTPNGPIDVLLPLGKVFVKQTSFAHELPVNVKTCWVVSQVQIAPTPAVVPGFVDVPTVLEKPPGPADGHLKLNACPTARFVILFLILTGYVVTTLVETVLSFPFELSPSRLIALSVAHAGRFNTKAAERPRHTKTKERGSFPINMHGLPAAPARYS